MREANESRMAMRRRGGSGTRTGRTDWQRMRDPRRPVTPGDERQSPEMPGCQTPRTGRWERGRDEMMGQERCWCPILGCRR